MKVDLGHAAVTRDAQAAPQSALAVGQFVEVRTREDGRGARALAVAILDAAVGRVTASDPGAGTIDVLGQPVQLRRSTRFAPGLSRERVASAGPDERLRVSGLLAPDGSVVATRVEGAPAGAAPLVGLPPADPRPGERFIIEGYVAGDPLSGRFAIDGLAFGVDPGAGANLAPNLLVRASGRTEADGRRFVEHAEPLAAPFSEPAPEERPLRPTERPARGEIGGR